MSRDLLHEQAVQLESLLPVLMRRLFTLDPDHPVSELPLAQLRVSAILQAGPRTLSSLSTELGISVSATSQIADRLERAGLIERVPGVDDRRTKYLQLSPQGAEMMRARRETRTQRAVQALGQLTPAQREAALETLNALLEAAAATAPSFPHEDPVGARQEQ